MQPVDLPTRYSVNTVFGNRLKWSISPSLWAMWDSGVSWCFRIREILNGVTFWYCPYSPDAGVVWNFRGWQTRIDNALRDWIRIHGTA